MPSIEVDGRMVNVTNEDRVLFPDAGITKGELVEYYRRVADVMVPHLKDRPVTMHRFPSGIQEAGFYHKNVPDHFPEWLETTTVEKEGGEVTHAVVNEPASLVYLANFGCITPHTWLSRRQDIRKPDRVVFDLDPCSDDFGEVRKAARWMVDFLKDRGLVPFVMTTGSRGIHVVSPVLPELDFDDVRAIARRMAEEIAGEHPELLTLEHRKEKRGRKIFVDYLRNAYAQTAVPPYAVRARPGAPVAVPLDRDELSDSKLTATRYTIKNLFRRLSRKDDPWKDIQKEARSLKDIENR